MKYLRKLITLLTIFGMLPITPGFGVDLTSTPSTLTLAASFAKINELTPQVVGDLIENCHDLKSTEVLNDSLKTADALTKCLHKIERKSKAASNAANAFLNKTLKTDCDGMCAQASLEYKQNDISSLATAMENVNKHQLSLDDKKDDKNKLILQQTKLKDSLYAKLKRALSKGYTEIQTKFEDKDKRAEIFYSTHQSLKEIDKEYKLITETNQKINELKQLKDELDTPKPVASILSFDQYDIRPKIKASADDQTGQWAISMRMRAQEQLLQRIDDSKNNEFKKKELQRDLSNGAAEKAGFKTSQKHKYYSPEIFKDKAKIQAEIDRLLMIKNESNGRYQTQQRDLRNNPIILGAAGEKILNTDNLLTYGSSQGLSEKKINEFLNNTLSGIKTLQSEIDQWFNDKNPEEFLKKALYLDPNLAATIISDDPTLAPLICDIAGKINQDKLFQEKMNRLIAIGTVVATGVLLVASLGTAALATPLVALLVGVGGGLAVGVTSAGINIYQGQQLEQESKDLKNFFMSLGDGSSEDARELMEKAKSKYISAAIDLGLSAVDMAIYFKALRSLKTLKEVKAVVESKGSTEVAELINNQRKGVYISEIKPSPIKPTPIKPSPTTAIDRVGPLRARLDRGEMLSYADFLHLTKEEVARVGIKIVSKLMGSPTRVEVARWSHAIIKAKSSTEDLYHKIDLLYSAGITKLESIYALTKCGALGNYSEKEIAAIFKNISYRFDKPLVTAKSLSVSEVHNGLLSPAEVARISGRWAYPVEHSNLVESLNIGNKGVRQEMTEVAKIAANRGIVGGNKLLRYTKLFGPKKEVLAQAMQELDTIGMYVYKNSPSAIAVVEKNVYLRFLPPKQSGEKGLALIVNTEGQFVKVFPAQTAEEATQFILQNIK